ncbi:30S ribosomal protein S8 [Lentisphaerota bacterium ZTH]|nr:30S ribosomal protein S8 [Lentisphaerota bacterium]WET06024.1 30S ribosomal protein S8 [Lentisphaerota bacterium ZTH]
MSLQDPISDMLTRIRNAGTASLKVVAMPGSKMKIAIADVLKEEGYICDYSVAEDGPKKTLSIDLKYYNKKPVISGIERVSKPSCRSYCGSSEIPKVRNGLGTVILSTPQGVISGRKAAADKVGGEILCYVW